MAPGFAQLPKRWRAGFRVKQFLIHHNKLDGYLALVACVWGVLTLLFPQFWGAWAVTAELNKWTNNHPGVTSYSLLLAGLTSYLSRYYIDRSNAYFWAALRGASALLAFSTWAMLAIIFMLVKPMFTPAVACYGMFAIGKAISYLGFVIQLDERQADRAHE